MVYSLGVFKMSKSNAVDDQAVDEALQIIEAALPKFSGRDLVESHEIVDLLLDTRRVLKATLGEGSA